MHTRWARSLPVLLLIGMAGCSRATSPGVSAGPTVEAAATTLAPTAETLQARVAATTQALAPLSAPTAQAMGTSGAPTLQALATEAAPIAATVTASSPVRVTDVRVATQDSTVTLENAGSQPVNLSNWMLQVGAAQTHLPSGVDIQPGRTVTVHTASGTNNDTDVYVGQDAQTIASQLRPGVKITLENPSGSPVSSFVVPNG